jgi:hypothetical protein
VKTYLCRHGLLLWLELRGRRAQPDHEDLDPYRLAPVLASRFVLDIAPTEVKSVETGTRVLARLPSFGRAPRASFNGVDGQAFDEFARIVAEEGNGAVIIAESGAVSLEILLLPLTLHRFTGRRVLGVVADCNPYAQPGETNPLKIVSCRFLARDLQEISPQTSYSSDAQNPALTAPTHSQAIRSAAGRQKLTLKMASRFLQ